MIVKTYVHLNRRIRTLNRIIKNARNEANACHAESEYYQAVIDNIWAKTRYSPFDDPIELHESMA